MLGLPRGRMKVTIDKQWRWSSWLVVDFLGHVSGRMPRRLGDTISKEGLFGKHKKEAEPA